jgi:murein DD-endopeptidase MepM/ murein hydrolase activator NlpD
VRAALAILLAVVALPAAALAGEARGTRTWSTAPNSPCDRPHRGPLVYHWPIKPFDRQHPIRGFFGDPRTLSAGESELGETTPRTPGSYTFHNGIDISAATGTAVYPVVSGRAGIGYGDEVIVVTGDGRTFQYFHVHPAIKPGQRVVAYQTVIGHVLPGWLHVHLSEIDGFRIHNPLDPGHLEPYRDRTVPVVHRVEVSGPTGAAMAKTRLHGLVRLAADASDTPPLPVPGEWFGFPVTPALIRWKLTRAGGHVVVPWRIAVDFRRTEPPNHDFWQVYAAGTYQNFPVFGHRYFAGRAGRYVFELTRAPLDTRRFANGRYVLTVRAADVCGNRGALTVPLRIRNYPVLRSAAAIPAIDRRSGAATSSLPAR